MTTADATYTGIMRFIGGSREQLTAQMSLVEDLGIDSIDRLALAADFEDEFDIVISDRAFGGVRTIGDMTLCVASAFEQRRIVRGDPPTDESATP